LAQRIIKFVNHLGPYGRLYEVDAKLRPTGKHGALAVSLEGFAKYFLEGHARLWERQALCRSRMIYGSPAAGEPLSQAIRQILSEPPWQDEFAREIRRMRYQLQENASPLNLKRSAGGIVDVEFIVQMLQLRHGSASPNVRLPGTLDAIEALRAAGYLSAEDAVALTESYLLLRRVEARLRLMNTTARHDLPADPLELAKLAFLLAAPSGDALVAECQTAMSRNRTIFERIFQVVAPSSAEASTAEPTTEEANR